MVVESEKEEEVWRLRFKWKKNRWLFVSSSEKDELVVMVVRTENGAADARRR